MTKEEEEFTTPYIRVENTELRIRFKVGSPYIYVSRPGQHEEVGMTYEEMLFLFLEMSKRKKEQREATYGE